MLVSEIPTIYESSIPARIEFLKRIGLRLYQGDCLNENLFDREFIDLIVTSPPYNVGIDYNSNNDDLSYQNYLDFSRKWLKKLSSVE